MGCPYGIIGIGRVRYSTMGEITSANEQPIVFNYLRGALALAHNGNIINAKALREELQKGGVYLNGSSDSGAVAYGIAHQRVGCFSVEEAVVKTVKEIRGGSALLAPSPRKLIAVRDPSLLSSRAVSAGWGTAMVASESCVIKSVGGEFVSDVKPGEVLWITEGGRRKCV